MSDIERLTVTLPADLAASLRTAVATGDYASNSAVVREALHDWRRKRSLQVEELAALQADIASGLADAAAGRVRDFDVTRIIERGRTLLARRSHSE